MLCNLSRCVHKLAIRLSLTPLLLSTNCSVAQVQSYRQDKAKTRNRRTLSRDPLGGGGCANSTGALLRSPTICNASCRTIGTLRSVSISGRKLTELFLFDFIISVFNLFQSLFFKCILSLIILLNDLLRWWPIRVETCSLLKNKLLYFPINIVLYL